MGRTAILISCSKEEASKIRLRAAAEDRGPSSYINRILKRVLNIEDNLLKEYGGLARFPKMRQPGARTAVLLRCSEELGDRIRAAALRRKTTISGYILYCLKRRWDVELT